MIGKNKQAVLVIKDFISSKKREKRIVNNIIRDDVFAILKAECIVLYYALDDCGVDGCHAIKPLNGRLEQFVFINTTKAIQEQTWTAAHELGHVWKVDSYVKDELNRYDLNSEDLVNRFAAEFLLPEDIFKKEISDKLKEYHYYYDYDGQRMSAEVMVRLVTYLMNYFCTPHRAIIRRFIELGYIKENAEELYLKGFEQQNKLYRRLMVENQYTRLETVNGAYSMGGVERDINLLEENEVYSEKKIARLREMFHLGRTEAKEESYSFGG